MEEIAVIVLAAGSSSRLGSPKQLLQYSGRSLLYHTLSEALKVIKNVVVVLGSSAEIMKEEIKDIPVHYLYNKDWVEGISSSIRAGLSFLSANHPSTDAAILLVSDQPFVSASLLDDMIRKYHETGKQVIACAYKDTIGVPVLFDKSLFPALLALSGQLGAKKIIGRNKESTVTVPFPLGYVDIDTKEDYEAFNKMHSSN